MPGTSHGIDTADYIPANAALQGGVVIATSLASVKNLIAALFGWFCTARKWHDRVGFAKPYLVVL